MPYQAIRGMKDLLPGEVERWQAVEAVARSFFPRFGFQEIRTPLLEKTELFVRSIGETTDVVEKEMYTFTDLSGDSVTLRPEATAAICRAYVEHKLHAQGAGLKVFLIGPMFRHERPQKGRFRQFHQIDCEILGHEEPEADAELIAMLVGFLNECRCGNLTVRVNSLGCPVCRPAYREKLIGFLQGRRAELCPECQRRLELNPLRALDCKSAGCQKVVDGAPAAADHLCAACAGHFRGLTAGLDLLGVNSLQDKRLVRGLDYYVRTTFEVTSDKLGGQDAVCGGGRYDGLIASLGGPDYPGTGFAIGLERLLLLSGLEAPAEKVDLFIAPLCPEAAPLAFQTAHALRLQGFKIALEPGQKSLKAALRRADKLASAKVLILGPEELAKGLGLLKDMAGAGQTGVELTDLTATLPLLLKKA